MSGVDTTPATIEEVPKKLWGYLVEFEDAAELVSAAERVRDAGYKNWDAHTPFPVHGLNDAMGLRPTRLPFLVFGAGATGCLVGLALQFFTNAVDYKYIISGKPFFSLPANIPVTFELTILFSATAAFAGMLVLNNLPQWYHGLFHSRRFARVTADRFFISIESRDPLFEEQRTKALMESLGSGGEVEAIWEEE